MVDVFLRGSESLAAIARDVDARRVVLRMAALAHRGRLGTFIELVDRDAALDERTRTWVLTLARNEAFLLAAAAYVGRFGDVN